MSRVSRRQRAHEEQAGKRKLRNLFALVFLLLAMGLAAYFIWANLSRGQTTIHVVIQRIQTGNYYDKEKSGFRTRRHAIPFQDSTAEQLSAAFKTFENTEVADLEPIQGLKEEVGLSDDSEVKAASISLLYVSGHLKLSEDRNDVEWIYPDQKDDGLATLSVKKSLSKIASSNGKLKIVLLDGGQYSWSPNHPNRAQQPFQDQLSDVIKGLDEDSNLWVILSHSPNEVSLSCTPEKMSIFGLALREVLKSFDSSVSVPEFFRDIYQRCATYSRNFDNESLQTPMLFKAGIGLVEALAENEERQLNFARSPQSSLNLPDEKKKRKDYFRDVFAEGGLRGFSNWLGAYNEDMHELPVFSAFKLENLIEPGQNLSELDTNIGAFNFNQLKDPIVKDKYELVSKFRQNCLDLKLQLAIVNQMLLWDVDQRENAESIFLRIKRNYAWSLSVDYKDENLKKSPVEPSDSLNTWNRDHEKMVEKLHESWLFSNRDFEKQLANSKSDEDGTLLLTPRQAEQLGVIAHRLIPYCKTPLSESTEDPSAEVRVTRGEKFQLQNDGYRLNLDLPEESNLPEYEPSSNNLWKEAYDTFNGFANSVDKSDVSSDSSKRVRLAVYSSEDVVEEMLAEIGVSTGKPEIEFSFENKLRIREGHNLLFGKIANSRGRYKISAQIDTENGSDLAGVEYFLFNNETDELFLENDGEASAEVAGEFVFYVFVRPAIEKRPDQLRFKFKAEAVRNPSIDSLGKEVEFKYSNEPLISVYTTRDIGTDRNESRRMGLLPWRTNSISNFDIPAGRILKLNALANLKSRFKFSFSNNSAVPMEGLQASLYLLSSDFNLAPDSISRIDDLTGKLGRDTWNVVDFFLDNEANARQLATIRGITIPAQRTRELQFSIPKLEDDKGKNGAGTEGAGKPVIEEYIHLDAPLLLTISDPRTGDAPLWFQFVELAPIPPFFQNDWKLDDKRKKFQIDELIKRRNEFDEFEHFKSKMLPEKILDEYLDASNSSAILHTISDSSRGVSLPPLLIEDAMNGENFQIPASLPGRTIAMADVMGIPNLITMEIDENQTTSRHSRIRMEAFAGIQVDSEFWEPDQVGFIYNDELFDVNKTNVEKEQLVYLRKRSEDEDLGFGQIKIRLALPFGKKNSPVISRNDYSFSWNQGGSLTPNSLSNPCLRKYFLRTEDFSFISTFARHEFSKRVGEGSIDIPLKIFQGTKDNLGELIGNYSITSTNPNSDKDIKIVPREIVSIITQVTIDLSAVKPYCTKVSIGIDDKKGLPVEEFPRLFKKLSNGRYKFKFADLADELGVKPARDVEDKTNEGGGVVRRTLFIEAEDFFRKKLRQEAPIKLSAPKKRR